MTNTTIEFRDAVPFSEEGFGVLQNTYGGGMLGVVATHFGGLGKILYLGLQPEAAPPSLFEADPSSAYVRLFRHQAVINGEPYNLEFSRTEHFPFGYASRFRIEGSGLELRHGLTVLDHVLVFSVEVLANPRGLSVAQRFEHHAGTLKTAYRPVERTGSAWGEFPACEGWSQTVRARAQDDYWEALQKTLGIPPNSVNLPNFDAGLRESITQAAFFADQGALRKHETHSDRVYFQGETFSTGSRACALLFGEPGDELDREAVDLRKGLGTRAQERRQAFAARRSRLPGIEIGNAAFESCLANVNPTLESLMPQTVPGGLRASSTNYWIWGWDTLLSSDVHLWGGNPAFVREMLRFFRDTAHPDFGYGHMFTRNMKVRMVQVPSAQCLYLIQLHNYFAHTGEAGDVAEFYPFAKEIFGRNLRTVNARGLGEGPALFPDYPRFAGHDGHDISVFNNGLLYQGCRCMEVLAVATGDVAFAEEARRLARTMERFFLETFWDAEKSYFVDSVDSRSFAQRKSYPAHALVWQSAWLEDLAGEKLASCGTFQRENLQAKRGFLMYPRWDKGAFDGDGNQLGQVWNTHDVFVTRCQAAAGRQDALEEWISRCVWYWKQLTYIEGYSAQTVNDSGTLDQPGVKQAFGAKSIYAATMTSLAGLRFDIGGVTLEEGTERPMKIVGLPFQGRKWSFALSGAGKYPVRFTVNDVPVLGTRKIPSSLLAGDADILFERTNERPRSPMILTLHGGEIHSVECDGDGLTATVSGWGHVWLTFFSPAAALVTLGGQRVDSTFDLATGQGAALLTLSMEKVLLGIAVSSGGREGESAEIARLSSHSRIPSIT